MLETSIEQLIKRGAILKLVMGKQRPMSCETETVACELEVGLVINILGNLVDAYAEISRSSAGQKNPSACFTAGRYLRCNWASHLCFQTSSSGLLASPLFVSH